MKLSKILPAMIIATGCMMSSCQSSATPEKDGSDQKCDPTAAIIDNIMTRTSIRQFTEQPVAMDTLNLLVKAGMAAPTAVDARPWAFVVVTEKEVLDSLNVVKPWFNLKTATAAIVVCGDMSKTIEGAGKEYWVQDCSAATENILLAAHAYGLGAVWCGVYPIAETVDGVKRVLQLPENIVPLDVITLGYPAENPTPKDKFNKDLIHYQKW